MSKFAREETNRIRAHDAEGVEYVVVVEVTRFAMFHSKPGGTQKIAGTKELTTIDGQDVDWVSKGRYLLQPDGIELSSDEEGAT